MHARGGVAHLGIDFAKCLQNQTMVGGPVGACHEKCAIVCMLDTW